MGPLYSEGQSQLSTLATMLDIDNTQFTAIYHRNIALFLPTVHKGRLYAMDCTASSGCSWIFW